MFKKGKPAETSQRFTIRKYHFGAASVLLGTFFTLGSGVASAEETAKATATDALQTVQTTTAPPATTAGEKFAKAITGSVVEQTAPKAVATTEATTTKAPVTTEAKEVAALVEVEKTAQAPKVETTTEAPKAETTTVAKKEEAPKAFTYTVEYREQATNAVVKSEVKTAPEANVQVTAAAVVISKENKPFYLVEGQATVRDILLNQEGQADGNTVVFYVNRQTAANVRTSRDGRLLEEGTGFRSADAPVVGPAPEVASSAVVDVKAPTLTAVANTTLLTAEEKALVAREIAVTNPNLVLSSQNGEFLDEIVVANDGSATITFKDQKTGAVLGTKQLTAAQTVVFSARTGDQEKLNQQIYWFAFETAEKEYLVNGQYTKDTAHARYVKDQDGVVSEVLQKGMKFTVEPIPNYKLELTIADLKPYLNSVGSNETTGKTNTYHKLASEQYNYTTGNPSQRANIVKTLTNPTIYTAGQTIPAGTTYVDPTATITTAGGKVVNPGASLIANDKLVEETNINGTVFAAGTTIGSNAALTNHFILKTATAPTVAKGGEVSGTYTTYQQGDTIAAGAYVLEDTQMTYDSSATTPVVKARLNGNDVVYTIQTTPATTAANQAVEVITGDVIKKGSIITDPTTITWKEAPIVVRTQSDKGVDKNGNLISNSTLRVSGMSTGNQLTNFSNIFDAANWGVVFNAKSTYLGKIVPTNALLADGETSENAEATIFKATNRDNTTAFQLFTEVAHPDAKLDYKAQTVAGLNTYANGDINADKIQDRSLGDAGFDANAWINPASTTSTDRAIASGEGTNIVGPTFNKANPTKPAESSSSPVWLAQGAETVELYYNGAGRGSLQMGFVVYDGGDAPQSYGTAQHMLREAKPGENGATGYIVQPFLGSVKGDPDHQTTASDPAGAWALDDVVYTENAAVASDEGEAQILDERVASRYNIRVATDKEYVLEGIEVNLGTSADKQFTNETAYVRSWVDFNNDGVFNPNESSKMVVVTKNKATYDAAIAAGKQAYLVDANSDKTTANIQFRETPQLLDTSIDKVGVRVRVSLTETELLSPSGTAGSGEVEDFQAYSTHKPRGTEATTSDYQDREQIFTTPINAYFIATGKVAPDFNTWAQIDTVYTKPQIVVTESVVKSEEPTGKTVTITDPAGRTFYTGQEVVIKDAKGNTLGTAVKTTNELNGTTEYYLTEYTEFDTAGNKVGVYNVSTAPAGPITNLTIKFDPEAGYVGTANGIALRAWDTNAHSTGWGVSEATIEEGKKLAAAGELAQKDVIDHNINDGGKINARTSMDSTYIPTVIDVRPVSEDVRTEDVQGATQSAKPQIPIYGTVETNTGEGAEEVYINNKHVILDSTKPVTFKQVDTAERESDQIDAGTSVAGQRVLEGTVTANNVRITTGNTVPAGSVLVGKMNAPVPVTVTVNGIEQTIPTGQEIPANAVVVTPFVTAQNNSYNNVTFTVGQTIPAPYGNAGLATLTAPVAADTFAAEGANVTLGGKTYNNYKLEETSLLNVKLPDATHIDPVTGAVSTVARSYTTVNDTTIVIKGEGTYVLDQGTGVVTFTPEPEFVGEGVGVSVKQPDVDYEPPVPGDDVTTLYGKDYGEAKYIPTVYPKSEASITRTIHYVYGDKENIANDANKPAAEATGKEDAYADNTPLFVIDNKPVTREQTLTYTRDYFVASGAKVTTEAPITTSAQVTDATGKTYNVGQTIPVGTTFKEGTVVVGAWTPVNEANQTMAEIVSPTLTGYKATVVMNNYKAEGAQPPLPADKATHTYMSPTNTQPVGRYTATSESNVGAYTPLVSEVTSDDKDNLNVYVVYLPEKQYAKVNYYDIYTGTPVLLKTETKNEDPRLEGNATHDISYTTAEDIAAYVAQGYKLVTDEFTNVKPKFDTTLEADPTNPTQIYNVYLTHLVEPNKEATKQEVTRTIEYKYEADKSKAAEPVTETLTFSRIDTVDKVTGTVLSSTPWTLDSDTGANATEAEKGAFDKVESPAIEGYTPDKAVIDRTDKIDALANDYTVEVLYKPIAQNTSITYLDVTDPAAPKTLKVDRLSGKTGETITTDPEKKVPYSTQPTIDELAKQGYVLAPVADNNTFPTTAPKYDAKDDVTAAEGTSQPYVVKLVQNVVDLPPITTPIKPGEPIPGTNLVAKDEIKLTEEVNRTVEYVKIDAGVESEAFPTEKEEGTTAKKFTRTAKVNAVTGEVTYGEWTPAQTFEAKTVKPLTGYIASVTEVKATEVNAEDPDVFEKVIYTPVGKYVPVVPDGVTPPAEVPYTNDPNDPTKITPPTNTVPDIPGTIPYGPDGKPLEPVDPKDPSKGYTPPTPTSPTENTVINYVKDGSQVAVTKFVLEADKTTAVAPSVVDTGDTGQAFTKDAEITKTIEALKAKGYTVVTDGYATKTDTGFDDKADKDGTVSQEFVITVAPQVVPFVPVDGENPPVPGQPVDPKNPDGPKWPDSVKDLHATEEVTRTINYVYNDGRPVPADLVSTPKETKKFTREAQINLVTGEITYGPWSEVQTFAEVPVKAIPGHIASDKVVAADNVNAQSEDITETVIYTPTGSWKPVLPPGVTPPAGVTIPEEGFPYPNPNEDPTKPGTGTPPTIPNIPGLIPVGPDGNELPKDPNGNYIPPVPTDPTQDTTIVYVKEGSQVAVTKFVLASDEKTAVSPSVVDTGDSGQAFTKDKDVADTIKGLIAKGYEVVSNDYKPGSTFDTTADKNGTVSQQFVVKVAPKVVPTPPVDGENPPVPGQPVDPKDPEGPKWPDSVKDLVTKETVTRTVNYVYSDGRKAAEPVTETLEYTREAKVNLVTGEITYGEWKPVNSDTTFDKVTSPAIDKHLVDRVEVAELPNVEATANDITETVIYRPLGSWIPVVPPGVAVPPAIVYPNDPKDPSKPGTDLPKVPEVPGTTPYGPDGNPLKPSPDGGYEVPPVPTNPGDNTIIVYVKDGAQLARTTFVTVDGKEVATPILESGDKGAALTSKPAIDTTIENLRERGYELVSNNYPTNGTFDDVIDQAGNISQNFQVVVKEKVVPTPPLDPKNPNDPKKPVPGQPVDPEDPEGPKWPETVKDLVTTETVTRTINYVYAENGKEASATVTETLEFKREAKINLVTGVIEYGPWTAADTVFEEVKSPLITGYLADKATVVEKSGVQATDADTTELVTYKKLGSYVPNVPAGFEPKDPIPYPNNPNDPTVPGNELPPIPYIPGLTPKDPRDPSGNTPLTPVDPNDPRKGYNPPPVPTDPTQPTEIKYEKDDQKAIINFVTETEKGVRTNKEAFEENGKSNEPIDAVDYATTLAKYIASGYEVVTDNFNGDKSYDSNKDVDQTFEVVLKEKVVPTPPFDPKNPNDPKKPVPGQPVDPEDPEGPKWPDSVKDLVTEETVTRKVEYKYEDGTPVLNEDGTPKVVTETLTFKREAKVNLVTGVITYTDWTSTDTTFDEVKSPVVAGYYADKATVVEKSGVQATDADTTELVTYKKLGSYVPNVPAGFEPKDPIPYPNDPEDPTVPGTGTPPVIPHVPGTTPKDPNGNPLVPVVPGDPTKGYVPPVPTEPGKDTPINYEVNDANLIVNYVDKAGNVISPRDTAKGKVGSEYTTTAKVIPGYLLVEVPANATGKYTDGETSVTYVYEKIGSYVPNIPGVENPPVIPYPNDPTDPRKPGVPTTPIPYVPGFIPLDPTDPSGNTPLTPVDPNDPTKGYNPPPVPTNPGQNTPINYVVNNSTVTVSYVDENGNPVAPSEKLEGKVGDDYTSSAKVIPGYLLVEVPANATGKFKDGGSTVTYVYKPIGSYVPHIPGVENPPAIPYPNDPTDPRKPGVPTTPIPYVPGFIPLDPTDPSGNTPLTPVDPNDPTKGYNPPPVPTNPGEDTPIVYVEIKVPNDFPTVDLPHLDIPTEPAKPGVPELPAKPEEPTKPAPEKPKADKPAGNTGDKSPRTATKKAAVAGALPKTSATGTETNSALPAGLAAVLAAAGILVGKRRRKED